MDDQVLQEAISEGMVSVADLKDLEPHDRICSICRDFMLSTPLTPETMDQNIPVKLGCGHVYGIGYVLSYSCQLPNTILTSSSPCKHTC